MRLTSVLLRCSKPLTPTATATTRSDPLASQPLVERFVPSHRPVPQEYVDRVDELLADKRRLLVLTGAGISTESGTKSMQMITFLIVKIKHLSPLPPPPTGIPDYRSEGVGMYARTNHRPVQHIEFVRSAAVRQRYWARNFIAWPRFSGFQPNRTHEALARFERAGRLSGLITQNVDRLHSKAGSRTVLELHGHGHSAVCVGRIDCAGRSVQACDYRIERAELQHEMEVLNADLIADMQAAAAASAEPPPKRLEEALRPDGDVDMPDGFLRNFCVPACPKCGGNLKTDVVFFGDNVPRERMQRIDEWLDNSDALLVLGSSLQVLSGYRIVMGAHERDVPVVIVNIGKTRADEVATIKLAAKCGDVVPRLFTG